MFLQIHDRKKNVDTEDVLVFLGNVIVGLCVRVLCLYMQLIHFTLSEAALRKAQALESKTNKTDAPKTAHNLLSYLEHTSPGPSSTLPIHSSLVTTSCALCHGTE